MLVLKWWLSQWIPLESVSQPLEKQCWKLTNEISSAVEREVLQLPEIDVQVYSNDISAVIESKYGRDWRSRPMLFRNMWTEHDLASNERKLSLKGLLQEDMEIPYFTNSSRPGSLTPDGYAKISDIVANISSKNMPHKIGTQLLASRKPELAYEVAPNHIVSGLFGNYFTPPSYQGLANLKLHPIIILMVAKGNNQASVGDQSCPNENEGPRTDMHCEPIANVLVQLEGEKKITLISPEYSMHLRPRLSPDGRAYIYSMLPNFDHVPRYIHTIRKGDAIYIPNWTWHRVDYTPNNDVAISGSMFFFHPLDSFRRNPLHSTMIIPNMIMEMTGLKAQ